MLCTTMNSASNISPQPENRNVSSTANCNMPPRMYWQPIAVSNSKRGRGADSTSSQPHHETRPPQVPPLLQPPDESAVPLEPATQKKSRPNNYRAAREVKPSILTAMGSLVGGAQVGSNISVSHRRQLSGGQLEDFLGGHDNMDMDVTDSRPRSMSF